jgi:hypothetical protein
MINADFGLQTIFFGYTHIFTKKQKLLAFVSDPEE